ncbi:MAG: ABC transporter permease subunit [Bacteroidetes bacterium]|nr:ABC transporter permease subunit [Bacteroidota bacterium]
MKTGQTTGFLAASVSVFVLATLVGAPHRSVQNHSNAQSAKTASISVGSKLFTESVILAEIAAQTAEHNGYAVERKFELGGTRFVWSALLNGEIDIYADYSGTLQQEILGGLAEAAVPETLASIGVSMTRPLGFNNTYALGMTREHAASLSIRSISDLADHPDLRFGFSNEFMDRADGWRGLKASYNLPQSATGLDHNLAYRGIESGSIDVVDLYSTDPEIAYYDLLVLTDDRAYFPRYDAVYLYRSDLNRTAPDFTKAIEGIAGTIDESTMVALNAAVKLDGKSERVVAADFLDSEPPPTSERNALANRIWQRTWEHLQMVLISLAMAVIVAIPFGIAASRFRLLRRPILGLTAVLYTIPALALLVFMIPLLGIGTIPAIAALFLYSLLPIVRNTYEGLEGIPTALTETATSLGLTPRTRLLRIDLPMASRSILAGIKTAAVINIGTATLGALIGAGGYGQPILTGIRLDSVPLILEGAVPAAILALGAQSLLELIGSWLIPKGLRSETELSS